MRYLYGNYTESMRNLYGTYTGPIRDSYVTCTGPIRDLYAIFTGPIWDLYGTYTGQIRDLDENLTNNGDLQLAPITFLGDQRINCVRSDLRPAPGPCSGRMKCLAVNSVP